MADARLGTISCAPNRNKAGIISRKAAVGDCLQQARQATPLGPRSAEYAAALACSRQLSHPGVDFGQTTQGLQQFKGTLAVTARSGAQPFAQLEAFADLEKGVNARGVIVYS